MNETGRKRQSYRMLNQACSESPSMYQLISWLNLPYNFLQSFDQNSRTEINSDYIKVTTLFSELSQMF
jgi:hypothetical protein